MVKTKKRVDMPAGIRNKLVAAVAMLLVASVLMVSSTYAWFTLSTAPEVTGITTSVGANGNLEIALLTTDTFDNTAAISSSVGDSSAHQAVTLANITWGNLVDLTEGYGLTNIKLMPAALNLGDGGKLVPAALLRTPEYGPDGRVAELQANTVSAVLDNNGAFAYDSAKQTYGVRAVGTSSNISPRQQAFSTAKSGLSGVAGNSSTAGAITANMDTFMAFVDLTNKTVAIPDSFSKGQVTAMKSIALAMQKDLNSIVTAYANAAIMTLANNDSVEDTAFNVANTLLSGATSAASLREALNGAGVGISAYDDELDDELTALADAQNSIALTISTLTEAIAAEGDTVAKETIQTAILAIFGENNGDIQYTSAANDPAAGNTTYYMDGGVTGTIASYSGKWKITDIGELFGIFMYAGSSVNPSKLPVLKTAMANVTYTGAAAASANISDTYGYVIDFAFRTNAATSNLLLQTTPANRVYSDGSEATQGGGSTVTYTFADGMNRDQAQKLLDNIRIVFFKTGDGTVYANAGLTNVQVGENVATADVQLVTSVSAVVPVYTVGQDFYIAVIDNEEPANITGYSAKTSLTPEGSDTEITAAEAGAEATISVAEYGNLPEKTTVSTKTTTSKSYIPEGDSAVIAPLQQNIAEQVSVLVYLDGDTIQNSDVVNGTNSGSLSLNLQFASSAELVPMNNTALKTMSVSGGTEGGTGGTEGGTGGTEGGTGGTEGNP